MKKKFIIL